MAQGLLGRSRFKYLNIIKKLLFPYPQLKKNKIFLLFVTTLLKTKLSYLILRSGKFGYKKEKLQKLQISLLKKNHRKFRKKNYTIYNKN